MKKNKTFFTLTSLSTFILVIFYLYKIINPTKGILKGTSYISHTPYIVIFVLILISSFLTFKFLIRYTSQETQNLSKKHFDKW